MSGCRPYQELPTEYGRRTGVEGSISVNGTSVFAGMFQNAGHSVVTIRRLSPHSLERTDVIVWFPDSMQPPGSAVRNAIAGWLRDPSRTLIYVGRDYEAQVYYWDKVLENPPDDAEFVTEMEARRDAAKAGRGTWAQGWVTGDDDGWFRWEHGRPRDIRTLQGDAAWRRGIDPKGLEMESEHRMKPAWQFRTVLSSEDDVLIAQSDRYGGQLILVANGSALLNAPLVNHEHRKLAGKLIDAVGKAPKRVAFLESRGDPPITDESPTPPKVSRGLDVIVNGPAFWVFLHVAAVAVLFGFCRWPIFGLPRPLPLPDPADFGQHLDAMATLMARSYDTEFARERVKHYRQMVGERPASAG